MKRFATLLTILLLAGAGCTASPVDTSQNERVPANVPSIAVGEGERSTSGTITSINLEGMMVDGPAVIVIKTETGSDTVHVPSMGMNLCEAKANIADVYKMKVGDHLEINGAIEEDGVLVPCHSANHYLRMSAEKKTGAAVEAQTSGTVGGRVAAGFAVGEGERASSGVVTSIDLDGMAVDRPGVIVIKTKTGTDTIHVPSMGMNLCEAKDNITDVYKLKVGDKVEVNGKIGSAGELMPCVSSAHYLRVAK